MTAPQAWFAARTITIEEALRLILRSMPPPQTERIPLAAAAGRVLAEAVIAAEDLWPFPRAAMDGLAVRSADLLGAARETPVRLAVVGAVYSGDAWSQPVERGTAVRIATGAPIPPGADAVVPIEAVAVEDGEALISAPIPAGRHVFPSGEDVRTGERVLEAGTVLNGGHLSLLAALGRSTLPVIRRPVVAILAAGDELVDPSTAALRRGQVRESNSYALAAEVRAMGGRPHRLGVARDDLAELRGKIAEGLRSDALVICGGASVGERDLVRKALEGAGTVLAFAGVAMKPGAPVAFGACDGRPVFVLPGTPGAARVAYEILVRPALRHLLGCRELHRPTVQARLEVPVKVAPGRSRFLWARARIGSTGTWLAPLTGQGTATLRSPAEANALAEILPGTSDLPAGAIVTAHLLAADDVFGGSHRPALVLGVVGAHGAGKTTVIETLIPVLRRRGLSAAAIKHHAHLAIEDGDRTDTARFARAGASHTVLAGPGGWVRREPCAEEPTLDQVLGAAGPADVILVEGYSQSVLSKLLVLRAGVARDRPAPAGPVVALVGDAPGPEDEALLGLPRFGWDETDRLAEFVAGLRAGLSAPPVPSSP